MPTLFRLFFVLAILGGASYGAIFLLATMVKPQPREMTVTVPQDQLNRRK